MRTSGAIDYVELPGTNLGEIKRFYAAAFGWRFVDYGPAYVAGDSVQSALITRMPSSS